MAIKVSTGLRNDMLGKIALPKAIFNNAISTGTLTYVDGGASSDTITASAGSFITAGFAVGDVIYTYGSTTAANDMSGVVLTGVAAGTLTFATATVNTGEVFAAGTVLIACKGGSLRDVLKDGVLRIYTGSQPSSPDSAASGTLLMTVSNLAGAWVAGAFDNGLIFGTAASGAISKSTGQTWQATAAASGTAGWFRFIGNASDAGLASTSLPRIDGNVGTSGADLQISSTTITSGATYTIDQFTFTYPEFYGA
jgi:hypothetical protein